MRYTMKLCSESACLLICGTWSLSRFAARLPGVLVSCACAGMLERNAFEACSQIVFAACLCGTSLLLHLAARFRHERPAPALCPARDRT
eukprot:6176366-Pleurochrysis_carterae.AAC.5